ncbi:MAG: hypothetical protein WAM09_03585, partial [Anaerolineales bacterium]
KCLKHSKLEHTRRVVVTQRTFRSELRMGEKLIPGDAPVIEYRRRCQALIDGEQEKEAHA